MLIHITPRFYTPPEFLHRINACDLVGFEIKEIGVSLTADDLVTRQPFPNKRYWVGSHRGSRKALVGMLFETPGHVNVFKSEARWAVNGEYLLTHEVEYQVLDREYGALSDYMIHWYSTSHKGQQYKARWPALYTGAPCDEEPKMEMFDRESFALIFNDQHDSSRQERMQDSVGAGGLIEIRRERFPVHTLERERVESSWLLDRMPPISIAIQCDALQPG